MTIYAMAVDPGEMSGIAWVHLKTMEFHSVEEDFDATCRRVVVAGHEWGRDLYLACEAFFITPETHKKSFQPWSLELLGVCRFVSRAYTGRELSVQAKSNVRKKLGTDDRLKTLGWYWWTRDGHANDAAGHLLALCAVNGLFPPAVLEQLVDK